jgi:hypothetical protein
MPIFSSICTYWDRRSETVRNIPAHCFAPQCTLNKGDRNQNQYVPDLRNGNLISMGCVIHTAYRLADSSSNPGASHEPDATLNSYQSALARLLVNPGALHQLKAEHPKVTRRVRLRSPWLPAESLLAWPVRSWSSQ